MIIIKKEEKSSRKAKKIKLIQLKKVVIHLKILKEIKI